MADRKVQKSVWNQNWIGDVKLQVRTELASIEKAQGPKARLHHILKRIRDLEDDIDKQQLLFRWVYCVSALVHHKRHGGLRERQLQEIKTIALNILKLQVPTPKTSRVGFMYGDVYLVLSQIKRLEGQHWMSAWEQQKVIDYRGRENTYNRVLDLTTTAIRATRMGNLELAETCFQASADEAKEPAALLRNYFGLMQIQRYLGRYQEARNWIAAAKRVEADEWTKLDIEWEEELVTAQETNDFSGIMRAVTPRGRHHEREYFLEAFLWAQALDDPRWRDSIAKVTSKARTRSLSAHKSGFLFQASKTLEECRDEILPLQVRIDRLGETINQRHHLLTIDKEVLLLAAAARWLISVRHYALARLTLSELEAIRLRMSKRTDHRPFQVFDDLFDRDWYLKVSA